MQQYILEKTFFNVDQEIRFYIQPVFDNFTITHFFLKKYRVLNLESKKIRRNENNASASIINFLL